ncbi:terminase small subunit [Haemophilus aegyptius]|nr:terminase small subunit [Haemophilus aegyptius]
MMNELTVKQSDFCLFYIETGNAAKPIAEPMTLKI